MRSDTPLDYAVFQLSPRRSRCELFVSGNGDTEKLASGLLKPFLTNLTVAEEQSRQAVQSIKLEIEKRKNEGIWFTKGTIERFVRFVSTPEVLELVNTFDTEMSQLEAARRIYLQEADNQRSTSSGADETGAAAAAADVTKKELLRAIDVRLGAVKQDLTTACARASAAGFTPDTVSELQVFSERFGAHRLNEACTKFISVNERRPDLICPWTIRGDDRAIRYSSGSDMSIDDQAEERQQKNQQQTSQEQDATQQEQSGPSNAQQPMTISSLRGSSSEKDGSKESEGMPEKDDERMNELPQKSQHVRRLSVQDRINMFENKQKEQTPRGSGGKVVVTKSVELRRMSSDVSSSGQTAEKAVLRRWSGASDMSIDQSSEKRETESSDSTPGPSSDSQSQATPISMNQTKDFGGLQDTRTSSTAEFLGSPVPKLDSGLKDQGSEEAIQPKSSSSEATLINKSASQPQMKTFSGRTKDVSPKDETPSDVEFRARAASQSRFGFFGAEQSGFKHEAGSQTLRRASSSGSDLAGLKYQAPSQSHFRAIPDHSDDVEVRNRTTSHTHIRASASRMEDVGSADEPYQVPHKPFPSRSADVKRRDEMTSQIPVQASSPKSKGRSGSRTPSISRPQSRDLVSDLSAQQSQWGFQGKIDEAGKKMQFGGYPAGEDKSSVQEMKLQRQSSAPEQIDVSAQPQKAKTSKGSQDRNDELQMKADELEKLFAAHKLRVPGDQSTTTSRRSKPTPMQMDQVSNAVNRKTVEVSPVQSSAKPTVRQSVGGSGKGAKLDVTPLMKMADNRNYGPDLLFTEDSRGKFYDEYMQKRNAKLKEEWSSGRGQKEAKLKAMQDSLERSRVEMEAKFAESAERRDSPLYARQRAEKFRSFNVRSSMKNLEQAIEFSADIDEILSESSEHTQYEQDGSFSETFVRDGSSRSVQSKKHLPNRNHPSSTSRTSTVPVPRSSTNPNSGRRRAQPDNPLAQSVPNFSDFRKENTKPTSGITKTANRTQARNYSRSKSTVEDSQLIKDEKPRCQSMRKSIAAPSELKDLFSPLNSQSGQSIIYNRVSKNGESKPFLKKGNGIGPGSGAGITKTKASTGPDILKIEEEYDDLEDQLEGSAMEMVNEEDEEEEFERELVDGELKSVSYLSDLDDEKLEMMKESEKSSDHPELENDEVLRSFCQVDRDSVAEMALPSKFHTSLEQTQDSPSESPISWNSHAHHPFCYIHESSDVDASMESPIGSPASWNSQSLAQMEADAARMRKKWGSAQPVVVANSLHHQSRKDVAKGFKRLLKFGRKSRGTESLVDWISATTSEGDDDTDDGRDLTNRSSEDLRKSRMGLSHDNDDDLFNEQVHALRSSIPNAPAHFKLRDDHLSGSSLKAPKSSFFSLSSFRSKGSETKPR